MVVKKKHKKRGKKYQVNANQPKAKRQYKES